MGAACSVEQTTARYAEFYAMLGAENDKFRLLWANADEPTRRLLLQIAKVPLFVSERSWDDLGPETRGKIKRRAAGLRDWLNRVLPQ